jgi:hypothetical protein
MVATETPQYSVMVSSSQHLPFHDLYNNAPQQELAPCIMAFLYQNKFAYLHPTICTPRRPILLELGSGRHAENCKALSLVSIRDCSCSFLLAEAVLA